jgi:hypothetical protein
VRGNPQPGGARPGRARQAAIFWVASAAGFVAFLLLPGFDDRVLQVETGYVAAALALCALLYRLYRQGEPAEA